MMDYTLILDKLYVFDKTKDNEKKIRFDNVNIDWEYMEIPEDDEFIHPSQIEMKIYKREGDGEILKIPPQSRLFGINNTYCAVVYYPNVVFENNTYIAKEGVIIDEKGDKINDCQAWRTIFTFIAKNNINLGLDDF